MDATDLPDRNQLLIALSFLELAVHQLRQALGGPATTLLDAPPGRDQEEDAPPPLHGGLVTVFAAD